MIGRLEQATRTKGWLLTVPVCYRKAGKYKEIKHAFSYWHSPYFDLKLVESKNWTKYMECKGKWEKYIFLKCSCRWGMGMNQHFPVHGWNTVSLMDTYIKRNRGIRETLFLLIKIKALREVFFQYCNTVHNTAVITFLCGSHSHSTCPAIP